MKYSNKQMIDIEKAARSKKSKDVVHVTDKSQFSSEDKMKLALCRHMVQFMVTNKKNLQETAELTGIEKTRLSEVTNYKFKKFSLDKLLHYLNILAQHDAPTKEYLKLVSRIFEMDVPTASKSKKIYRAMEDAIGL